MLRPLAASAALVVALAGSAAAAPAPAAHSVLRKSFHFMPLRVPAALAAWYLVPHSFVVRPVAVSVVPALAVSGLAASVAFAGFLAVVVSTVVALASVPHSA